VLIAAHHRAVVGGAETYLRDVLPRLAGRGHELALLHETPTVPDGPAIDDGLPGLPAWRLGELDASLRVGGWRPDVCYVHGLADRAAEADLLSRYPAVLFAHGQYGTCISGTKAHRWPAPRPCRRDFGPGCLAVYLPYGCGGLSPLTMWRAYRSQTRQLALLPRYRTVLVASRFMHDLYVRLGLDPDRVRVLPLFPTGVAPDPEPPAPRPPTGRVVMVGRLVRLKGGHLLVAAVARAAKALGRPLTLTILGDGPERTRLEALARRLGVPAEFTGWLDPAKRNAALRAEDVLGFPGTSPETFGLVGVEAGCVGLPAVAFDIGGTREWLVPGVSGEFAPADPPTAAGLADALVRALADEAHRQRLRVGAWETARRFSPERHLDGLERELAAAVGGRPPEQR
jgi:glycosyltransferase involved in cell wall biosynthesis